MIRRIRFNGIGASFLAPIALFALAGCEVKNPGAILDEDLNLDRVIQALVTGMSADFSEGFDDLAMQMIIASDELEGSGSYFTTGLFRRGILDRDELNDEWGSLHRARWVAEAGLMRMDSVLGPDFDGNPLTAKAHLFAALANRVLGESMCYAVIDVGPVQPHTVHFDRALTHAAEAIRNGQLAGEADVVTAAHGIRAQAFVGLGDWASAVTEAAFVPIDFVFAAIYSDNSSREENEIYDETHRRPEMSAWSTYAGTFDPPDPRAPYAKCDLDPAPCQGAQQGADGSTIHWMQQKLDSLGSDIPVVKGTDMRLIEAEAALVGNDRTTAMTKMNEVRAEFGLAPLAAASDQEAWIHLDNERYLTNWLEARRFADTRRWDAAGLTFMPSIQHLYGMTNHAYGLDRDLSKRGNCFPISFEECSSNPNLRDESGQPVPECQGAF